MNELREKTLIELFGALDGIYGPNYECKYYPCHFENQDCSLCYCPFYPCLICDLGEIKVSSEGNYVWSCENCFWIHEKENVENVLFVLGNYPKQRLVEENWLFYNKILQELLFGEEIGEVFGNSYSLMPVMLNKNCEVVDNAEFLAITLEDFCITQVRRIGSIDDANQEILIPLKADNRMFGFVGGNYLVCYL